MTSIILETNGSRPRMLEQTLRTLYGNTPKDQFNLVVISEADRFDPVANDAIIFPLMSEDNCSALNIDPACHVTGRLKNLGAYWSEKQFGRSEFICFIDDDVAFFPGWLEKMTSALTQHPQVRILGGNRHPYHGINETIHDIEIVDAVAGYCMLMKWYTWTTFRPFEEKATGIMQGEDVDICQKVVKAGGKVGYIHPPVLAHTGITNSVGGKATGADQIERIGGVLYE